MVAAGPNVKNLKVNDWVIPATPGAGMLPPHVDNFDSPLQCLRHSAMEIHSGTWRTHRLATEDNFLSVPNDIPVEYAATLAVNPATAHLLLTNFAKLKAGTFFSQQLFCFLLAGKIPYILSLAGTPNTHSKQQVVDVFVLTTLFPQVMLLCKTAPTVA